MVQQAIQARAKLNQNRSDYWKFTGQMWSALDTKWIEK